MTACAFGARLRAISLRWCCIASVVALGITMPPRCRVWDRSRQTDRPIWCAGRPRPGALCHVAPSAGYEGSSGRGASHQGTRLLRGVFGASFAVIAPTRSAKFFNCLELGRILPKMARARRDVPEPEPPQQLADRALVIGDVPAGQDQVLQVDTAPAHHPVALEVGPGLD